MPFKSRSQMRLFFAKEKAGEITKGTARRWLNKTRSVKALPEKVASAFTLGFRKIADNMPEQAREAALWDMEAYAQGQEARQNATTGQREKKNYTTEGVRNEKREFGKNIKVKYHTARGGRPNGYND